TGGGTNWFMHDGNEYLVYMDGQTGKPYQCIQYPLKRLESGETSLEAAWGDGYGHRSSKHFFGAPYFDGKKPSIFLARGIYTRHKMIAYDVNPDTHALQVRWKWYNNSNGPWKGQGYHNYCVADVDWDGRDEIVFGSMVIDDNGKGLSTTGLGHGDAEHVGDLNPYVHGHEIYACLEDNPGNNYRDATTSKIYHRCIASNDDGRSMAGNFTNAFPGGLGCSAREGAISLITGEAVSGLNATGVNTNFRIYWDGDLCEETFNYKNGKNTEGCVAKYGSWNPIYTCEGSLTNNDTKGTPCYQGDILGDWREEIIMRTASNNIRIYSTPTATTFRIPSLWADHQYRNAMVWQMCGYNQPPHASFYLGEIEGITQAPPPLTTTGRTSVANGGAIGSALNGQHVLFHENADATLSIEAGAAPSVLTFNVPSWVQGTAASECTTQNTEIKYTTYSCTVTGSGITGSGHLVKQGDGILTLPKADFTHTGETNIWAGTLNFDGTLTQSPLWLNRFAQLNSDGGSFKSISAHYGSVIRPGGADKCGTITVGELTLGHGSRIVVDLFSEGTAADCIQTQKLTLEQKTGSAWTSAGPEYLAPVIEVVAHPATGETKMAAGKYVIAEVKDIEGSVDKILLEGLPTTKKQLYVENGRLILEIMAIRDAANVIWNGSTNNKWDYAETANFLIDGSEEAETFVSGDNVLFNDSSTVKTVNIVGSLYPATVTVDNTYAYTFSGTGSIEGTAQFIKQGKGMVTMNGTNSYRGGNYLKGGTVKVSQLANAYNATGNLGSLTTNPNLFTMEGGATLQTATAVEQGSPMKMVGEEGGVINNTADFRMSAALSGTVLTKKGKGCLFTNAGGSLSRLVVMAGSVAAQSGNPAATVELQTATLYDDAQATTHVIEVPKNKTATWQLTYSNYTAYANRIIGEGTLTIIPRNTVSRVSLTGNWSEFKGTIKHVTSSIWLPLNASTGLPKGTLDIAEGCTVTNVAKSFTIGKLTGKGSLAHPIADFKSSAAVSGNNTWNVGNDDLGDFTFAGTFTDGGGSNKCLFNKVGTCKMTVSGQSTHSGATRVNAGELCLKTGAQLGTGSLTVAKGATLSGTTSVSVPLVNSNVTIGSEATLHVGSTAYSTYGQMNFGGKNVSFANGSVLQLGVSGPATETSTGGTCLQNINKLTMNGKVEIYVAPNHTLEVGSQVLLWKEVTTVTGTPVLSTYYISDGLYWDDSEIAQGILKVTDVAPVGVRGVLEDNGATTILDLSGRRVATPRSGQTYIINGRKILFQ
ncbi:MAG: autotransporter-associated beta strand repeat-containing protein, partial [Bacteroidaceae bacterium]|nr:autotransporter-associated beta strand repeat-containing protein [Bacteroidaceae bacterium]